MNNFSNGIVTRAKAIAEMVAAVAEISCATVKSATNAIKWATLRGNAKKTLTDAIDATVSISNFYAKKQKSNI